MINTVKICISIFILFLSALSSAAAYDLADLTTAPFDSLDAADMKIWVPVEGVRQSKVNIKIYTAKGKEVRHLFEGLLPKGYYYFYWDKLDDSGRYAPAGSYTYRINYSHKDLGIFKSLKVRYTRGGDAVKIKLLDDVQLPGFDYTVLKDSAILSLEILNSIGKPVKEIFKDSLFEKGDYTYRLTEEDSLKTGKYLFQLKIDDYILRKLFYNKMRGRR